MLRKHRSGTLALVLPEPLFSLAQHVLAPGDLGDLWKAGETLGTGPGTFRDVLTSKVHRVDESGELPFASAFATLPVALLMREA